MHTRIGHLNHPPANLTDSPQRSTLPLPAAWVPTRPATIAPRCATSRGPLQQRRSLAVWRVVCHRSLCQRASIRVGTTRTIMMMMMVDTAHQSHMWSIAGGHTTMLMNGTGPTYMLHHDCLVRALGYCATTHGIVLLLWHCATTHGIVQDCPYSEGLQATCRLQVPPLRCLPEPCGAWSRGHPHWQKCPPRRPCLGHTPLLMLQPRYLALHAQHPSTWAPVVSHGCMRTRHANPLQHP